MVSVAGKGKGALFFHPSGAIEPALNGFSRERIGKGTTVKREREKDRGRERQERKLERQNGRVLGL